MIAVEESAVSSESLLGVERSVLGRRWRARAGDQRLALALAQRHGLPEIVGRLLAARGIALEEAAAFLAPRLRAALPDPSRFVDMDRAAERLARAIRDGEAVAVFGDYDVDGATSAALLHRFFAAAGASAPLRIYVPDRLREGYGPNLPALLRLKAEGVRVVVTVDCGTLAFEPLAGALAAELEVIVVDHHTAEPRLPPALAVVNPNRLDEAPGFGQLAAVGVVFLLVVAVNRALRQAGWYGAQRPEPDLLQWLDIVALGTVCDVVPLTGLNRALVAQGLKVLGQRSNAGMAALCDVASLSDRPEAYHLGFVLGPRVNAGGRVGESSLGARLLSTNDAAEAASLARRLDVYNQERRALEQAAVDAAIEQVEQERRNERSLVFAAGEGWHPGVVGIVASRLVQRYGLPACVVALGDGIGRGSGRSLPGVDLGAAVIAARQDGLLINGGGHPMAAGFTVAADRLPALRDFLSERLGASLRPDLVVPTLDLDGALQVGGATVDLATTVERLGPFGSGNPRPKFALNAVRVFTAEVVGADHVRCVLSGSDNARLSAIAFRSAGTALGRTLLATGGMPMHLAGCLTCDRWQGQQRARFEIEDAAPAT